jgi:pimeloyl-ACP methyl ester carboxylesterase
LAEAGYRVIVPYLRGFGTTRFLSDETFRNGGQAMLAVDVIALMDALEIERAIVAGFDWGARSADIVAALWPERCTGLVSVSGYLIVNLEANQKPLPPKAELGWWYQYEKFSGAYSHRILEGIGHNVPQGAPGAFTDAILEVGGGPNINSRQGGPAERPKTIEAFGGGSGDIDARDVKAQEAAEGCAEYERPQEYRQYR